MPHNFERNLTNMFPRKVNTFVINWCHTNYVGHQNCTGSLLPISYRRIFWNLWHLFLCVDLLILSSSTCHRLGPQYTLCKDTLVVKSENNKTCKWKIHAFCLNVWQRLMDILIYCVKSICNFSFNSFKRDRSSLYCENT